MKTIYATKAKAFGGRNGKVKSEDNVLDLEVRVPKEMGGNGGNYSNPEQLFAAGYSACFHSALLYVASARKIRLPESSVTATVGLYNDETGGFALTVELNANIPDTDEKTAQELFEEAHKTCPYSKAIKGNVEVKLTLTQNKE